MVHSPRDCLLSFRPFDRHEPRSIREQAEIGTHLWSLWYGAARKHGELAGWEDARTLHLGGAPEEASGCSPMQSPEAAEPLENKDESSLVQSGAAGFMVGARGLEPRTNDREDEQVT